MVYPTSNKERYDLIHQVFLQFAWDRGEEAERLLASFLEKAAEKYPMDLDLPDDLERAARQGRHSLMLEAGLLNQISRGASEDEIKDWIERQRSGGQPSRSIRHLEICAKQEFERQKNNKEKFNAKKDFVLDLPTVSFKEGLHPQSLRSLAASSDWQIYIDETGTDFTTAAQDLEDTDRHLGRVVALAVPSYATLKGLKQPTHSTDLTHAQVQDLITDILSTENTLGILGATLKQDLYSANWMSAVYQLVRWVMLMLPLETQAESNRVRFFIENRSPYTESGSLKGLEDRLASNLKQLLPERFKNLHLSLELMTKDNSYNGYVDAIAHLWGSPDPIKKEMLRATQWIGPCLLQGQGSLGYVERLYRDVSQQEVVSANEWFELCYYAAKEGEGSLLGQLLNQMGETVESGVWLRYLAEVQQRVATKDFNSKSLSLALQWLNHYRPLNNDLPPILALQLLSTELAAKNHQGQVDENKIAELFALINRLEDEDAVSACNALLRISVAATNAFDFGSMTSFLEEWVAKPIAVPGLLNHAKLHSTLGQLSAFRGENQQAISQFDTALALFKRLSDPKQASRDSQQTQSYRLFALLEAYPEQAQQEIPTYLASLDKTMAWQPWIRSLARSESSRRFEHHLFLRFLISFPTQTVERNTYMDAIEGWKNGAKEGHPWMLINAYRAWLLYEAGQQELADDYFALAISECLAQRESKILTWMGHCFIYLQHSLKGHAIDTIELKEVFSDNFPQSALLELANAKNNTARLHALNTVLPFNFH